jgi:hypothetical protein
MTRHAVCDFSDNSQLYTKKQQEEKLVLSKSSQLSSTCQAGRTVRQGRWFPWNVYHSARHQWWANLDQASKDLDKTIFRDLSPTPIP